MRKKTPTNSSQGEESYLRGTFTERKVKLSSRIFKVNNENYLASNIMEEVFQFREPLHILRSKMSTFLIGKVRNNSKLEILEAGFTGS